MDTVPLVSYHILALRLESDGSILTRFCLTLIFQCVEDNTTEICVIDIANSYMRLQVKDLTWMTTIWKSPFSYAYQSWTRNSLEKLLVKKTILEFYKKNKKNKKKSKSSYGKIHVKKDGLEKNFEALFNVRGTQNMKRRPAKFKNSK